MKQKEFLNYIKRISKLYKKKGVIKYTFEYILCSRKSKEYVKNRKFIKNDWVLVYGHRNITCNCFYFRWVRLKTMGI